MVSSSSRKAKKTVLVFKNAIGGPRVLENDVSIDITEETADGKKPQFETLSIKAATKRYPMQMKLRDNLGVLDPLIAKDTPKPKAQERWEKLTMLDRFLIGTLNNAKGLDHAPMKHIASLRSDMISARKFVLTDRAAERIGAAVANYPEFLAKNSEFAIPPFDTMWIELPMRTFLGAGLVDDKLSDKADLTVGYFISNGEVHVIAEDDRLSPMASPVTYHLHRPPTLQDEQELARAFGVPRNELDAHYWGLTLAQYLEPKPKRELRKRHTIGLLGSEKLPDGGAEGLYIGSAGELRNILALLLMINQPAKILSVYERPRGRTIIKGKVTPYMANTLIDIDLDRKRRVNLLKRPKGIRIAHGPHRWHEVRGHFCQNKISRDNGCTHEWHEYEPRKWECKHDCGARRWWRELPNGRGDASVGFVDQVRRVKTAQDKAHD